jgi:YidC/Oxa1 family membrane protein insertase
MILVGWHAVLTFFGMQVDGGLTWVLSIAGVVVIVRTLLIPLFVKQIKSQRKMMEVAPEMKKIQEKYRGKKDQLSREAMSRETMALYKKHGTTPVSGCLPMLVQMPVFLSLFYTLLDVKQHAADGIGGVGMLTPELTAQLNNSSLFGIAPLSERLTDAIGNQAEGWVGTTIILTIMVALMIGTQFFTQLQIVSKNLSPEAKTGQAYMMQRIMLYIIPFAMIFSGVFFPLGVVSYWFFNNLWTMCQQFLVIREMPTPGSEAAKAREERLARKGKALNAKGKVVTQAEYEAEQQELLRKAEAERAKQPKRQQPMSAKRAKKQQQNKGGTGEEQSPSPS